MKLIKIKFKNRKKSFDYYEIFVKGEFSVEYKSLNLYTLEDISTMFNISMIELKKLI
jgi:hypothetical protein